jgi:hypothetical protein
MLRAFVMIDGIKKSMTARKFGSLKCSGANRGFYLRYETKHTGNWGEVFQREFSGPRTPQRNCKGKRNFQTFGTLIRAMLSGAGLKDKEWILG